MKALHALAPWLLSLSAIQAQVVINEIYYDPEPKTDRTEFIELHNAGATAVELSGWRFSDGIDFTFPPDTELEAGGYLILTEDLSTYNRKFGSIFVGGLPAFAEWASGRLSNDGERVRLENPNGEIVDEVDYKVGFPWPVGPNDNLGLSMELLHPGLDNDLGGSWRSSEKPTPGRTNSVFSEVAPPHIRQVRHTPELPKSGESLTITAKVTDPEGLNEVNLQYQLVEPGDYIRASDERYQTEWTTVPMTDDGTGPDLTDGDHVFSVELPGALQAHRRLLRYRITAEDTAGHRIQVPYADDARLNFAAFTYDGAPGWTGADEPGVTPERFYPPEVTNALPIYHLISQEEDVLDCQYNSRYNNNIYRFEGTLIAYGEVYDHIRYRIRGQNATYNTGKNKWKFRFNRGQLYEGRDNFGRKYPVKARTLNFSGLSTPWNPANRGMAGLDEALAFRMFQMTGIPSCDTNYFHYRVIDQKQEAGSDQYEGDLWGLYIAMEQPDSRFLKARDLPDGNLFKMQSGASRLLNQGRDQVDDLSDLREFVSSRGYNKNNPIQPVDWWRSHVDLPGYYNYRSVIEAINHSDLRDQENSIYYSNPETGLWVNVPWDLDLLYEEFDRWGPDAVQSNTPFEQFRKALLHDEIMTEFQNRARELQDLFLNQDQLWTLIDEFASLLSSSAGSSPNHRITAISRPLQAVTVETNTPHGLTTGQKVYIKGVLPGAYNGVKNIISILSPTAFTYTGPLFAAPPEEPDGAFASASPDLPGFAELDRARWDHHPRSRSIEGPSTGTGSYFLNPYRSTRFSGKVRTLESADFPGMVRWVKDFTVPPGFGGGQLKTLTESSRAPGQPELIHTGPDTYPVDQLTFQSGAFSGGSIFAPQNFVGMKFRIGEVSNPTTPHHVAGQPAVYEIDPVWESERIDDPQAEVRLPAGVLRLNRTYRVRVRHLNQFGHWSHWSEPVQFEATAPDLTTFSNLVLSEFHYHPAPPTTDEAAAGFTSSDFEFIELHNRGAQTIDLTPLRLTKGVDFDFETQSETSLQAWQTLVLTRNAEAFALRYGETESVVADWGSEKLANGGETLKLSYGAGIPVIELTYDDTG
ncbi:MAG: lamin tail domain-containing protein, partial [Verrucomicrobiota bacterium]